MDWSLLLSESRDAQGRQWRVMPDALVGDDGARLPRAPAHRAFWFGWVAQHSDTCSTAA